MDNKELIFASGGEWTSMDVLFHYYRRPKSGPVNARRATIEMQSVGVGWGPMTA